MKTITIPELMKIVKDGDVLMTAGKGLFCKGIRIFQELQGDVAVYTHIAMFPSPIGSLIIEANKTLDYKPLSQYIDYQICVIRHKDMTPEKFDEGVKEIANNIGQKYPYYRLVLHAIDNVCNRILRLFHVKPKVFTTKLIKYDNPLCSEWIAQLYFATGLLKEWLGVNPDDFDDWRIKHPEIWETIFEGKLT